MIPSLHRATGAAVGSPRMVLLLVSVGTLSLAVLSHAQTTRSGRQIYESACAACPALLCCASPCPDTTGCFVAREKIGPGAILIPCANAR